MPEPRADETYEDWMDRCMSDPEQRDSFPEMDQRSAVCNSKWEERKFEKQRSWPPAPRWRNLRTAGKVIGVDRGANNGAGMLRGFVVAQQGPFKSEGRGEFDNAALREIMRLGNTAPKGLKSRFTHPDMSADGLGKFLGRASNFNMSTATDSAGEKVPAVRADLNFDPSAHDTPSGDLAGYVMRLAENDPEALSSSLVLEAEETYRLESDGTPARDDDGEIRPPLWRPTRLHASDIVDTGDAVDGLLSAELSTDNLPMRQLWRGAQFLDEVFKGQPREVVEARLLNYLRRYLARRFPMPTPTLDRRRERLEKMARECKRRN